MAPCLALGRYWLHPDEQIAAAGVVHDTVRVLTGHVEVNLAGGLLAWGDGGGVDALGGGDLEQGSVHSAICGTGVEIRNDRGDGALEGFITGGDFPQLAAYLIGDRVGAGFEIAHGPALNDIPVDQLCLLPYFVGGGRGVVG